MLSEAIGAMAEWDGEAEADHQVEKRVLVLAAFTPHFEKILAIEEARTATGRREGRAVAIAVDPRGAVVAAEHARA